MQTPGSPNFSEEQQIILNITEGDHLVLAPPGSGKTELLATRVELALNRGLKEEDMICLTFTNRAAKNMKNRISRIFPDTDVLIGNIHHFCTQFLSSNRLIPPYMSMLDEADAELLMEEAIDYVGFYRKMERGKEAASNVNLFKLNASRKQRKLGFPEEIITEPGRIHSYEAAVEVCETYEKLKKETELMDFDDVLIYAYYYLRERKGQLTMCHYKWLQLDEAQDLNPLQWAIVDFITDTNCNKVYFGDYEQAIFSFTGASLEKLHELEQICTVHNLRKNFRSPKYLLDLYTTFAKNHLHPRWKQDPIAMRTDPPEPGALQIVSVVGSVATEAEALATFILPEFFERSKTAQNAILVRTNGAADTIGTVLDEYQFTYFKISGFDFFKRKFVKDTLAYITCMGNIYDKLSWARLFYLYAFDTLRKSRKFIKEAFGQSLNPAKFLDPSFDMNWHMTEKYSDAQKEFLDKYERQISRFVQAIGPLWQQHMRAIDQTMSLDQLITDFIQYNKHHFPKLEEFHDKNTREYWKWKRHIDRTCKILPVKDLLALYVREYKMYKESDLLLGDEQIIISTVHKAKGLEFENVIVAECVDGCYPFRSSKNDEELKEAAKVLYVAMTRARKRLCITVHTNIYNHENVHSPLLNCIKSKFEDRFIDGKNLRKAG